MLAKAPVTIELLTSSGRRDGRDGIADGRRGHRRAGLRGLALARVRHARTFTSWSSKRASAKAAVLTQSCQATGQTPGRRPAWFWPDVQPRIGALLDKIELVCPACCSTTPAIRFGSPTRTGNRSGASGRLGRMPGRAASQGGSARLVDTRAAALPAVYVRTGSALLTLRDRGAWLELQTGSSACDTRATWPPGGTCVATAARAEHVRFDPPLPALPADALAAAPTLLSAALAFNHTSCVVDFPGEHERDAALLHAIALELNARPVHAVRTSILRRCRHDPQRRYRNQRAAGDHRAGWNGGDDPYRRRGSG
ncbi:hypothetical protein BZM26_30915 [Paraburkholderia strydomiana]|nr:hypothetical protein BZM26_30915 [Paraburkholderia strydomiana]